MKALTKEWVRTEMVMALTHEIEHHKPRVVIVRVDDCQIPLEAAHKGWLYGADSEANGPPIPIEMSHPGEGGKASAGVR